ncbi:MAG: hypothetical protein JXA30_08625 [Deltaproteobacteria bacterium]|nr:hypothetical protein [Deltaproteobacteria bacterium]
MQNRPFFLTMLCGILLGSGCTITEGEVDGFTDDDSSLGDDSSFSDDSGEQTDAGIDSSEPVEKTDASREDAGKEDSNTPALPTVEDLPYLFAYATCGAIEDCEGSEYLAITLRGKDCVEHTEMVFMNRDYAYLSDSVSAGRVAFNPENVEQCLEEIRSQGCDVTSSRRTESCQQAVQGTVSIGSNCVIDADCEGNAFCGPEPGEAECPTVCRALLEENEACEKSDQCENGRVCAGGICATPPKEGEKCCLAESDASCWDLAPAPCARGLECTADTETEATCKRISEVRSAKEGETCEPPGLMCEVGGVTLLSCVAIDSSTGICKPKVEQDGTCQAAQPSQCPVGQYCDAEGLAVDGKCVDLPDLYQPCRAENQIIRCAPGLICDLYRGEMACVPINSNGSACESDEACYSGICGEDGNCVAPPICE